MHDYTTLRLVDTAVVRARAALTRSSARLSTSPLRISVRISARISAIVLGAIHVTHPQMDLATGSMTLWLKAYIDYLHS